MLFREENRNGGEPVRGMTPRRSLIQIATALLGLRSGQPPAEEEKSVAPLDPNKTQSIVRRGISAVVSIIKSSARIHFGTLVFPRDDAPFTVRRLEEHVEKNGGNLVLIKPTGVPQAYAVWVIGKGNNCFVAYYVVCDTENDSRTGERKQTHVLYLETLEEKLPPSKRGSDDIEEMLKQKYLLLARERGLQL